MKNLPYNHKLDSIDICAPQYHERQEAKQEWDIGRWLRIKGIDLNDLDGHIQISDVITLINIRDELWDRMDPSARGTWSAYWDIVYRKSYPLTKKFWKKFENVVKRIDQYEETKAQKLQAFRDHLKAQHKTISKPEAR